MAFALLIDFRLIVVAEKEVVYRNFPIPLINRLEKHILSMHTMLSQAQITVVERLESWASRFVMLRDQNVK